MGIYFFKEESIDKMGSDIILNKDKYLTEGFKIDILKEIIAKEHSLWQQK